MSTRMICACAVFCGFVLACCSVALAQGEEPAVVSTEILSGDPTIPGGTFALAIRIDNNHVGPVGTYAFRLLLGSPQLEVEGVSKYDADGFNQAPSVEQSNPETCDFSGVDALSNLVNGRMCVFHMKIKAAEKLEPYTIGLTDIEPTPLVAILRGNQGMPSFPNIPHVFDFSKTSNIGGAAEPPAAVVYTELETPGPFKNGDTVSVAIKIRNNQEDDLIGTYAFQVGYSPDSLELLAFRDGTFGQPPTTSSDGPLVRVSAYNARSTFANGTFCIADFKVKDADAERFGVMVQDYGPTPLTTLKFQDLPHSFEQRTAKINAAPGAELPAPELQPATPAQLEPVEPSDN